MLTSQSGYNWNWDLHRSSYIKPATHVKKLVQVQSHQKGAVEPS